MATERRTRTIHSVQRYAAVFGAAIIGFGFIPVPLTDPSLPKATWLEWFIAILPLMPFAILALSIVSRRRVPLVLAVVLAVLFFGAGAFATIVLAALSGGGSKMVLLHGTALTLACGTSILLASAVGQKARRLAFSFYTLPVFVGVWSLAMIPMAYSSAVKISSGRAFCIGEHSSSENELRSIFGLRGLSFYTTRSGYKIGDTWYFHGLLLVEENSTKGVYNWSPRNMQFQAVERPRLLFVTPSTACEPRNDFFQKLDVI